MKGECFMKKMKIICLIGILLLSACSKTNEKPVLYIKNFQNSYFSGNYISGDSIRPNKIICVDHCNNTMFVDNILNGGVTILISGKGNKIQDTIFQANTTYTFTNRDFSTQKNEKAVVKIFER